MACGETSFNSYSFTCQWKVNDLEARLRNPSRLSSPEFISPPGATPVTKWELAVFLHYDNWEQVFPRKLIHRPENETRYLAIEVKRLTAGTNGTSCKNSVCSSNATIGLVSRQNEDDVWVEAQLKPPKIVHKNGSEKSITSLGPVRLSVGEPSYAQSSPSVLDATTTESPMSQFMVKRKASVSQSNKTDNLCFERFIPLSEIQGSQSVLFECQIRVWFFDDPVHEKPTSLQLAANAPEFNLSKIMEEARQKNLFTDVTIIVADGVEFKAHKVVLAAQSHFFKTRFEGRWREQVKEDTHPHDRVEMTDVPMNIMEAVLSYVYTGKVAGIEKIAYKALSIAKEYGIEGLRNICEQSLAKMLSSNNAIDMLIFADDNNAQNLRAKCIKYISTNAASVRGSEGWSKLKDPLFYQRFGFEILEAITECV